MSGIGNISLALRVAIAKLFFLALVLVLALPLGTAPAQAKATTYTENYSEQLELYITIPCALGGVGEVVHLSGQLHIVLIITVNDDDSFMIKVLSQPQGISGLGLTSGDRYRATGETGETFSGRVGFEYTFVNNFKIIGQGPGNNLMIHENLHLTVHPDGTLTADVNNFSAECRSSA